jgi:hypothetical protein
MKQLEVTQHWNKTQHQLRGTVFNSKFSNIIFSRFCKFI